ncbi:hypothetical protein GAPWKB11_1871 [Gilliamella apicola]|nr:hypothetical protein GAPWKB11_1871 [Gilliamella apicola]
MQIFVLYLVGKHYDYSNEAKLGFDSIKVILSDLVPTSS